MNILYYPVFCCMYPDSSLVIDTLEIQTTSVCYEGARISWRVCSDDECAILSPGKIYTFGIHY